jgi:hypothetical protein
MSTCEFPRCPQAAQYCFFDEPGVARFCSTHKDGSMVPLKTCEFPGCSEVPLYSFFWETTVPRFCAPHKSSDMVLADGAKALPSDEPDIAVVFVPAVASTGPSEASLELAYKYFELKPEYDSLENIKTEAATNQIKLGSLKSQVKTEVDSIHKTSEAIAKLEKQLESQDNKWLNVFGKSIFGLGILMKDQKLIDKKTAELKIGEEKKAEQEGKKKIDETDLSEVQAEQVRLDSLVEIRNALDARVQELRATCLEVEGTTALRRLQSKHQNNERMHESLKNCRQDVATAATMFKKALGIQAKAARSNAMAAGANIGQAIGGGGGRGIGNSPGERLMQIRRNQATKQSIEIAKEAAGKLNLAQDRLSNDLRVNFPEEMKGVGIIDVPDLWTSVSSWWWKGFLILEIPILVSLTLTFSFHRASFATFL